MSDDDALRQSVDDLRGSVDTLGGKVDAERDARVAETATLQRKQLTAARALRKSKWTFRLVVAVLFLGLLGQWEQNRNLRDEVNRREGDRVHAAVVSCQNANVTRQAIEDRFTSFIDVLVAVSPTPPTAEAEATRKATVEKLRAEFAARRPESLGPRDCSVQAVTAPTTIAPGS